MRGTTNVPSVYVLLKRDGKLAFVLRSNTDFKNGEYCLPAGHVEGLESFRQAAVREAKEEAGVTIAAENLRHVHTMHRHHGDHVRVDVFFEASNWEGEPFNAEPESHSELTWFNEADLPFEKIVDWQAAALKSIIAGETYSEFNFSKQD